MWSQTMLWCRLWWSSIPFNIQWRMARGIIFWKWIITTYWLCFFLIPSISLVSSYTYTYLSSPMVYFNVYSFICSGSAIDYPWYHCRKEDATWIYYSARGQFWAPWAVCLRTHLSTPNQNLHTAPSFTFNLTTRGTGQGERFEVFWPGPPPPHAYSRTGPAHSPHHPLSHLNLLFISFVLFYRQCNPESTLPCYSFV